VLLLLSVASVSRWKVSCVRAKRDASAYGRPHTRTRVTPGFIKNTRPYFLRRVASRRDERAAAASAALFVDYRAARATARQGKSDERDARRRRIRIDGRNFTRFWVTRRASERGTFDGAINGSERR